MFSTPITSKPKETKGIEARLARVRATVAEQLGSKDRPNLLFQWGDHFIDRFGPLGR